MPVILDCFQLRSGSGGRGLYNGGDGVVRELRFRRPQVLSVLTERRVYRPYGMKGMLSIMFDIQVFFYLLIDQ